MHDLTLRLEKWIAVGEMVLLNNVLVHAGCLSICSELFTYT